MIHEQRKLFGEQHPETVDSIARLAIVLSDAGKLEEANRTFEGAVLGSMQLWGVRHRLPLQMRSVLGKNLLRQGRLQQAMEMLRDVLDQPLSAQESDQWGIGYTEQRLGCVYVEQGHADDGIPLLLSAVKKLDSILGRGHPDSLETMQVIAEAYRRVDRVGDAEAIDREIVTRREEASQEKEAPEQTDIEFQWERQGDEHVVA